MSNYRIRVQVIVLYEVVARADSPEGAIAKVEALGPAQIEARGRPLRKETGLADPATVIETGV
ncbi:MAG: hypothetical protein ACREQN_00760 [Candidatus Binataceae bacterium]